MKAIDPLLAHATAVRALREALEDYRDAADVASAFGSHLSSLLGMSPLDPGLRIQPRMTQPEVRALIYPALDAILTGAKLIEAMNAIDAAMAAALASPKRRP